MTIGKRKKIEYLIWNELTEGQKLNIIKKKDQFLTCCLVFLAINGRCYVNRNKHVSNSALSTMIFIQFFLWMLFKKPRSFSCFFPLSSFWHSIVFLEERLVAMNFPSFSFFSLSMSHRLTAVKVSLNTGVEE